MREEGRPAVVALGGGHGLATTLSAVARYAGEVTAVVSAADDGGSSGRLRTWWDGPAPGDVRRCLLALAAGGPEEKLWAQVLDHRFPEGSGELAGHSLGNLVLVGLTEVLGDFVAATAELARLLGVAARLLPATPEAVQLCAVLEGGQEVEGQAKVATCHGPIRRVWLRPPHPAATDEVVSAIARADQVILGPGSLFTSVLAVCAVPGVRAALGDRRRGRVYVSNLRPQVPETQGYGADAHLAALARHELVVDAIVCDPGSEVGAPSSESAVAVGVEAGGVVRAALAAPGGHAHDPALLAEVLRALA